MHEIWVIHGCQAAQCHAITSGKVAIGSVIRSCGVEASGAWTHIEAKWGGSLFYMTAAAGAVVGAPGRHSVLACRGSWLGVWCCSNGLGEFGVAGFAALAVGIMTQPPRSVVKRGDCT